MTLHDYFPSIVRLAGCCWRVFSPAGFHALGCPAQERYFALFPTRADVEDGALAPRPAFTVLPPHTSSTLVRDSSEKAHDGHRHRHPQRHVLVEGVRDDPWK